MAAWCPLPTPSQCDITGKEGSPLPGTKGFHATFVLSAEKLDCLFFKGGGRTVIRQGRGGGRTGGQRGKDGNGGHGRRGRKVEEGLWREGSPEMTARCPPSLKALWICLKLLVRNKLEVQRRLQNPGRAAVRTSSSPWG